MCRPKTWARCSRQSKQTGFNSRRKETDESLDWLEAAVDKRYARVVRISVKLMFEHLRSHPRYHALMRKMNLEP